METERRKSSGNIELCCRGLWKVFGSDPTRFFRDGAADRDDPRALFARMREQGHIPAVCNVDLDFREGEISVVMGLSGSGKSTLVRCLSRLVDPTAGALRLGELDMMAMTDKDLLDLRRQKMGMVFQNFGLLPHLTARENIAFPLELQGVPKAEQIERADKVIELVRLWGREDSLPSQMSGGQQQRVGIARSLIVDPQIWFLDEPFSALDPLIRKELQDELLRLQQSLKKTIVFITHDFDEAIKLADRIAIMRDGFVVQYGTPAEIVFSPADDYVAEFVKDVRKDALLTCGQAALPAASGVAGSGPTVLEDAPMSEGIALLLQSGEPLEVVDASGNLTGIATHESVLKAMFADARVR